MVTKECYKDGHYRNFAVKMLKRVNKKGFEERLITKIWNDLRKVMLKYEIPNFIETDPFNLIHANLFDRADNFIKALDTGIKASYFEYRDKANLPPDLRVRAIIW